MSYIILPEQWSVQPPFPARIDWNNPLSVGLAFATIGWTNQNEINLAQASTSVIPPTVSQTIGRIGDFNGSTHYLYFSAPVTDAPLTIMTWASIDTSQTRTIVGLLNSGASNQLFEIRTDSSAAPRLNVQSGSVASALGPSNLVSTVITQITALCNSTSSRFLLLDGVAGSENTTTLTPSGIDLLSIGRRDFIGGNFFDGKIGPVYVWNRALSINEILMLKENPWQLYQKDVGTVYFIPAVAGISKPVAYHHRQTQGLAA